MLFSRCIASAMWQIDRTPKSHHLNIISSYRVSGFSRTCECLGFLKISGPKPYTPLLSPEQVSLPHFQHSINCDLGGIQDILTFLISLQFEMVTVLSLLHQLHIQHLLPLELQEQLHSAGLSSRYAVPEYRALIKLFICYDVLLQELPWVLWTAEFSGKFAFGFFKSSMNFPGPRDIRRY